MYFHSLQAFLRMGGYALYVWLAYSIVLVTLIVGWLTAYYRLRITFSSQPHEIPCIHNVNED